MIINHKIQESDHFDKDRDTQQELTESCRREASEDSQPDKDAGIDSQEQDDDRPIEIPAPEYHVIQEYQNKHGDDVDDEPDDIV